MYAIVTTGGKQYRVEQGQSLLVERLPVEDGGQATLRPLLYVDGDKVVDGEELAKVSVEARVVGHERGPKLRVVKFKPKRGYKRRTGHRQALTRIEVTQIKLAERRSGTRRAKPAAAEVGTETTAKPAAAEVGTKTRAKPAAAEVGTKTRAKPAAAEGGTETTAKPAAAEGGTETTAKPARTRRKPPATESQPEEGNGA